MNEQELEALLESHTQAVQKQSGEHGQDRPNGRLGIYLADPVSRRFIEGLSVQLDLKPEVLEAGDLGSEEMLGLEMVLADEASAGAIQAFLQGQDGPEKHVPALVAVRDKANNEPGTAHQGVPYEGMITLPEQASLVTAQLGVVLYAHRAYVRRYHDAMEELLLNRRIFRSVTSGITVARAEDDLPLVYVNPAFEVISGYTIEESLGKNCRFLQREHREQPGLTLVREAVKEGREIRAVVRNYRKDGTAFWNELAISPIRNHEGKLTHFVGIQQDVTARVEFEEALRESEKLATAGRLAASIAHEINNPLEAVTNLIYLARHSTTLEEVEAHLGLADEELRRVALLTSQSLRFYKQSSAPQAARPSEILDAVLDVYQRRVTSFKIQVERRERTIDSIVCFESELRQVFSNLVRNAIDAMKNRGGGRLLARTREATDWMTGNTGVMITVADTGVGMSPEVQRRIFEAFYSTKGNSGTGLGLWVSREIVNRHRGKLRVRSSSAPEKSWTVFQLFLPYQGVAP